jgi:hypothetical protein
MLKASQPFRFLTASYLTRIDNERAMTVRDLRDGLERCTEASIFYHTFQSLDRHHFLTEGFSNDFAQWALAALNRPRLAEQLGCLDIRDYMSLADLRTDLLRAVDDFGRQYPEDVERAAFEPFHFCSSIQVTAPLDLEAWTLEEFSSGLEQIGHTSFHFHFLVSRLRLKLQTNDFSVWFGEELGLEPLGRRINQIDILTNTIDGAKAQLTALLDRELSA